MADRVVRAAGGLITREGSDGAEILLVHRPRYDDWTLPKGKAKTGETDEVCALREVEEETSLSVELCAELIATEYVSKGRPKRVRYWLAEAQHPEAARAQNEVDEIAWLAPGEAEARLSYDRDVAVLRAAVEALEA
jgi:8-oxo-dGTP pyrophosphatase MutT (NUDIX family)